jgi:guanylate kinase
MIFVISGPGGVGKGSVVDRLVSADPTLHLSRSWTTRARRPGESESAYVFVDEPTFLAHLDADGFLEHTRFAGNNQWYGTPRQTVTDDHDLILEIEVDGAAQVKKQAPDAVMILIVPPSRAAQEERLRARGDDEEHIRRRLAVAEVEEREGRKLADHVVLNDDLDRAVAEVAGILADCRAGARPGAVRPAEGLTSSNGD